MVFPHAIDVPECSVATHTHEIYVPKPLEGSDVLLKSAL